MKWAVPYKLDNWRFVPLKKDLHETFEGKEGYEKGGKEIKDAAIDVTFKVPINNPISKEMVQFLGSSIIKKTLDKVFSITTNSDKNNISDNNSKPNQNNKIKN